MRFILGVVSALALLGAGAVTYTVMSMDGKSTSMAAVAKPAVPAAVSDVAVSDVAMAKDAAADETPMVSKSAMITDMQMTDLDILVPAKSTPEATPVAAMEAPVEAPVAAPVASAPVDAVIATTRFQAPRLEAPELVVAETAGVETGIQAQPDLKAVVMLAAVEENSPLPPIAETTPADPVEVLYVTGGRVNMRSGPGSRYAWVATLDRGSQLMVVEKGDRWHKVSGVADGNIVRGWMAGNFLSPEPVQVEASNISN